MNHQKTQIIKADDDELLAPHSLLFTRKKAFWSFVASSKIPGSKAAQLEEEGGDEVSEMTKVH